MAFGLWEIERFRAAAFPFWALSRASSPRRNSVAQTDSFEAADMDEAVRLVSKHPSLKAGPFEIRPVEDMTEMVRESERRRSIQLKNDGHGSV